MDLTDLSRLQLAGAFMLLFTVYRLCIGIYRVYFSPVSHIPGPFLAKWTSWYQHYYNFQGGKYVWQIDELHKQYGPIIRIGPEEVHVKDAAFFEEIYASSGRKRNKWAVVHASTPIPESIVSTLDHDLHRKRRAAVNPFFSKQKVHELHSIILGVVDSLMGRIEECGRTGEVIPMTDAFSAMGYDIICQYALGYNDAHVHAPDFAPEYQKSAQAGANLWVIAQALPWVVYLSVKIPNFLARRYVPGLVAMKAFFSKIEKLCLSVHHERASGKTLSKSKTIFHHVLADPNVPESEKGVKRLWQDGYVFLAGGMLTVTDNMHFLVYALLTNPERLRKLKDELRTVMPDVNSPPPSTAELEKLPYLYGVVAETLRLANGAILREPLIDPIHPLIYTDKDGKKTVIPPGTPMSSTPVHYHFDPEYFPDPHAFLPERWIPGSGAPEASRKAFFPFLKGSRSCIGFHLAYAEMYLATASIFRRYGSKEVRDAGDKGWLELYDFDFKRDLEILGDGSVPIYSPEAKSVRCRVFPE